MSTLLQITSSIFGEGGNSTRLAETFSRRWQSRVADGRVIRRDLAAHPLPEIDATIITAWSTPEQERDATQAEVAARSERLIRELDDADVLVVGVPMYNFGIPSQLKNWIDHIARAGISFRYTEQGAVGLLRPKPVLVVSARGGIYADTGHDHQEPYLRQFFGFVGLDDVRFVYAEGVNLGEDVRAEAMANATQRIEALADELANELEPA